MEMLQNLYRILLTGCLTFLSATILLCLIRAVMGPHFTDRIVCINIVCTKTIILIAGLSLLMDMPVLVDVAIVYAMISFLAVLVLSKCYLLPHHPNAAGGRSCTEDEAGEEEQE